MITKEKQKKKLFSFWLQHSSCIASSGSALHTIETGDNSFKVNTQLIPLYEALLGEAPQLVTFL